MDKILQDDREIKAVHNNLSKISYILGKDGVTEILSYGEPGQMARVPFLAVHKGDEISHRIPANQCTIEYNE